MSTSGIQFVAMIGAAALVSASAVLAAPSRAGAIAFTPDEQRCHDAMAKGGLKLAQTVAKTLNKCHKDRSRGNRPAETDCNDVTQAGASKVTAAQQKLSSQVTSRCAGQSTSLLGYTSCPAPCDGQVPSIDDFSDAAACLACLIIDSGELMSANAQGSPTPPLGKADQACHAEIGKSQTKHFQTVLKAKRACQRRAERFAETSTATCAATDPRGKISRARDKAELKINQRCAGANLANVDSCATDLSGLNACVLDDSAARGTTLFESSYALPPETGGTTTTTIPGTTTTTTTTTTLPQDPLCPTAAELTIFAEIRGACITNADCPVGTCDNGLGKCRTVSSLDTGWTGLSHDSDIVDDVAARSLLHCSGPFDGGSSEPCGVCSVEGIDSSPGNCRCALVQPSGLDNNRIHCDEPFQADMDDCGGGICDCYLGSPLPLSAGNTPVCVINRFRQDVTGTTNVDTGESETQTRLFSVVHNGLGINKPCPTCEGDITPKDGVRNGVCSGGQQDGQSCDVDGFSTTFPAPTPPGGAGYSLDCFPITGANITGQGLRVNLDQTTGVAEPLSATLPCFFGTSTCHCRVCSGNTTLPCSSNADCAAAGAGNCTANGGTEPKQNQCDPPPGDPNGTPVCNDVGGGDGECADGPTDKFCDGVVRGNGVGFVGCNNNADCQNSDCTTQPCGLCTLTKVRECFLPTIVAQGSPDPSFPVGASIFCLPGTSNPGVNATAGIPGPGRVVNQTQVRTFCASNPAVEYQPGIGGCP